MQAFVAPHGVSAVTMTLLILYARTLILYAYIHLMKNLQKTLVFVPIIW